METVNATLKKTKNINAVHADGHTPLMCAAYNEHDNSGIIQALLDKGADVNIKAADGTTALSWALKGKYGNSSAVKRSRCKIIVFGLKLHYEKVADYFRAGNMCCSIQNGYQFMVYK